MIHNRQPRFLLLTGHYLLATVLLITANGLLLTAHGQRSTATLSGSVVDPNDAAISGVKVTVTDPATRLQRVAITNDSGRFVVPLLPPSTYNVTLESSGFVTAEINNVVLNVNDDLSLPIKMKIGDFQEMVNVTADASLVRESPSVGTIIDRQFVGNLPLNGRSFQTLIALTPGTVVTKANFNEAGQFSVNGQRANANYFTVDGVSANAATTAGTSAGQTVGGSVPALGAAGGTNTLVSVDALQEFKVQTSTYAPEFGRSPGAQVQILTRSGTNDFHGTLFNYFRNDTLDANDWFANSRGLRRAALRQNDFGGVLSGPVLLPRFGEGGRQPWYSGRNRTFFFFSYEGLRLRQPQFAISDVPTLATRNSAVERMRPFLNAFPLPNGPATANGLAEFAASFSNPSELNATSIRIDRVLNKAVSFFGRYNYAPSETVQRSAGLFRSINNLSSTSFDTQTLTFGMTHSITPKVHNELRINHTRYAGSFFSTIDNFGGAVVPPDSLMFPASRSRDDSIFSMVIVGGRKVGFGIGIAGNNLQRQFNIVDNLSVLKGSHQLKFGIDYRRLSPIFGLLGYSQSPSFNSVALAVSGRASAVVIAAFPEDMRPLITNLSLYAQDTWRPANRLSITYGIRWELNPPPTEQTGKDQFAAIGLDNPSTLALGPRGTPIYNTTYANFAPRIGIAYRLIERPGREIILRGGFGLFYDLGNGQATTAFGNGFPYSATKIPRNEDFPLTPALAAPPPLDPNLRPITRFYAFDPNLKLPRVYQWNFSLEQSLGANQSVSASFLGAAGRRLLRGEFLSNPNSNFQMVNVTTNNATSDYHATQIQFRRRLSGGLQALGSYTWSKSLDIASIDSSFFTPSSRIDPRLDRGPSDFDIRHALTGAVTYDLPSIKIGSVGEALVNNWSIDTIFTARSAAPVNIRYNRDIGFGLFSLRPDVISGIDLYIHDPRAPGGRRFNDVVPTAAQIAAAGCAPSSPTTPAKGPFCTPLTPRQGTLGRNALRGFPLSQVDLTVRRQFKLTESLRLRLSADFFNILNHPNFADPLEVLTSTSFGVSQSMLAPSLGGGGTAGGLTPLYQIGGARSVQLSLKLQF